MGFFDRFRGAKPTAPPPNALADKLSSPPLLPSQAEIATYVVVDAVGIVQLATGEKIRFGRSSCKGFEPVVGAKVILEEVAADSRGWKAKTISLDPENEQYDSLLAARDKTLGLPSNRMDEAQAAATARQLALVTLLFRQPIPQGTLALKKWSQELGFPCEGIDVNVDRDVGFTIDGSTVLTYVGRGSFPVDGLDTRDLPQDFSYGRSFMGLGTGLPGMDRMERQIIAGDSNCWAANGKLRNLSRLIAVLADHISGVVLHRAGDFVVSASRFVSMLGDLKDSHCIPFAAWLDIGITERNGEKVYATFGMDTFGLPDVCVAVDASDRWSRSRCHEAVLFACHRMVRENRELVAGENLVVPVRIKIGAWPVEPNPNDATFSYSVVDDDQFLKLVPAAHSDLADEWRQRGAEISVNAYQALFDRGLADLVPSDLVRDVSATNPSIIPHCVEVRARRDSRGYMIVTNGFGRIAQREPDRDDCTNLEVTAWVPTDLFSMIQLVGSLARNTHSLTGRGWKPGDTLAVAFDEIGIAGFVVADGGTVEMGGGTNVRLLLLVPLEKHEYDKVRDGGSAQWLSRHVVDEHCWERFVARLSS